MVTAWDFAETKALLDILWGCRRTKRTQRNHKKQSYLPWLSVAAVACGTVSSKGKEPLTNLRLV